MNVIKSLIGGLIGAAIATGVYFAVKQSTGETYMWFPIVTGLLTGVFAGMFAGKTAGLGARYVCGALAGLVAGIAIFGVDVVPTLLAGKGEYGPVEMRNTSGDTDPTDGDSSEVDSSENSDDAVGESDSSEETGDDAADEGNPDDSANSNETDDGDTDGSDANADDNTEPEVNSDERNDATNRDMGDRSRGPEGSSAVDPATTKRFAELIRKQSNQSWFDLWMPYVFSGIGILLAYQLARGFGSNSVKPTGSTEA